MGLAYEMVINSDPCIAYLMEENSLLMQTLVLAHASVGHSAVFKNNYMFVDHTDATSIVDYLNFAKTFLKKCEEKYGEVEVENVIDACHALQVYGIDKYKKPRKLSPAQEEAKAIAIFERELDDYDVVWEKVGQRQKDKNNNSLSGVKKVPAIEPLKESQENILYFIEKNAPHLPSWKREVIRIIRKLAEYFRPQRETQVVNEGYATFTHHFILNDLYDSGQLDAGSMIEFLSSHAGVLRQPDHTKFNPYQLGFSIFTDIKRICEGGQFVGSKWVPITDEDRKYFPNLIGKDWATEVNYAMKNFKDESFILQYLSPKVARDLKMFAINDAHLHSEEYSVEQISNEKGFEKLRQKLSAQYAVENITPDVQIVAVDSKGTRKLMLEHFVKKGKPLHAEDAKEVNDYIAYLWEYSTQIKTIEYSPTGEEVPLTITSIGKYAGKS
jgi:spore cortex formation protein SpoVR/YcgB (stage V sporulation)